MSLEQMGKFLLPPFVEVEPDCAVVFEPSLSNSDVAADAADDDAPRELSCLLRWPSHPCRNVLVDDGLVQMNPVE